MKRCNRRSKQQGQARRGEIQTSKSTLSLICNSFLFSLFQFWRIIILKVPRTDEAELEHLMKTMMLLTGVELVGKLSFEMLLFCL